MLEQFGEVPVTHDRTQDIRMANTRLVVGVARTYQGRGLPLAELVEEGNAGLLRAAERFDWRDGRKFPPYAACWIRQSIQHALTRREVDRRAHRSA
jgi:RNA polymerase primary sigma factor